MFYWSVYFIIAGGIVRCRVRSGLKNLAGSAFIAFGGQQAKAGLSPAVARLGKPRCTPHQGFVG
jgi:hypothetical protein